MSLRQSAYNKIEELVIRFEEQHESYKRSEYNETQTRRDFIDPFFKALGWDMDNEKGYAESYREVIHEDRIKISGSSNAPDYSFRLSGGKKLFFVEAKKPSVDVKDEISPAYQIRRYGWSAKLPISIITDFEEFSVYDCTKIPKPSDKASTSRIKYLTYRDYLTEFDFLWNTFNKEQVLKGSFDKFVQSDTYKKGTATVDKQFLQSLDDWRKYLASNISLNNKSLDEDEVNFTVQQTINRIIFLRIAEDRGVEPYGTLKEALIEGDYYKNLFEQFNTADTKYNSGLFDFGKDKLSENLTIDNKTIKTIINDLYYPESPYEFSVLSVEILGSSYEQFLGKVIRITPSRQVKIEEKPEVRKAGGVYYTPQYIVDYIVKNTLGKLIDDKTPKEISKVRIVDPACGSGSFLLGAYQYLLDRHKDYYTNNGKTIKVKKDNPLTPEGNLTTNEKKRILLNNIYGVDLDVNAVEVTKLSLLLKCMEGETEASINFQVRMFHERVLPDLDSNIKSGNSLIDTDFYDNQLDFGDDKKIKPFNWERGFPEVFSREIEKDYQATSIFHVTCVMHNSRTSKRMVTYKVKKGKPEYLCPKEEQKLVEIITDIIRKDNLKVLEMNICADHLHIVISCNPKQLPSIIGKLKSVSAREFNIWRGVTIPQSRGQAPLTETRGETQHSLWSQKFNRKPVTTESQLRNVMKYVRQNRAKHSLLKPPEKTRELIENVLTPYHKVFETTSHGGGFDVVIGNPPYVRQELLGEQKKYFQTQYKVYHGVADLYSYFIERGINLLNDGGMFGIIVANKWMRANYGEPLRKWLKEQNIIEIIDFGDLPVFESATTYPCILIVNNSKKKSENFSVTNITDLKFDSLENFVSKHRNNLSRNKLSNESWNLASEIETDLLDKLKKNSTALKEYVNGKIYRGILTGLNEAFVIDEATKNKLIEEDKRSAEIIKPFLVGKDIKRYGKPISKKFLIFFPKGFTNENMNSKKNAWLWLSENYTAIANYLKPYEEAAKKRYDQGDYWWELRACDYYKEFEKPKIMFPDIALRMQAVYDTKNYYCVNTAYIIPVDDLYLLGILNSNLVQYFYSKISSSIRGGYFRFIRQYLEKIPISTANIHRVEIENLVSQIIKLNSEFQQTTLESKRQLIQNKIDHCETKINHLVYELYGLTAEEIKIVEGGN